MKINKPIKPVSNEKTFNEVDMLYCIKDKLKELSRLYIGFLLEAANNKTFAKVEEVTYEIIEDYRTTINLLYDMGWLSINTMDQKEVIELIKNLNNKKKIIEK